MELARYLRVLRQRLWLIIACPLVAAVAAAVVSYTMSPVYEAHAWLLVRPVQPLPTGSGGSLLSTDQILRTYAEWMTQRPILESVASDLSLPISSEALKNKIKVTPQVNTLFLDIAVQDTNPKLAADIANQLVKDFQAQAPTSTDNFIRTADAIPPTEPVSPQKARNIAFGFAAGLVIAIGFALLLDYLDQSVKSDDELIGRLGLIPLGHIDYVPAPKEKRGELVALDTRSPSSEAFKALRTSILFSTLEQKMKAIVVTSPEMGEGKSRIAANLAVSLAQAGYNTLLIDADFRRPSQHRIFGRVRNIGLSNLIIQDASDDAIQIVDAVPKLSLLTSGPTPPNPSELLGSAPMRELMLRLWHEFSYVIIDTPPLNAVTDAAILAGQANAAVVVVEQGRTTFPALKRARDVLDRVNAHVIGAVMNKLRASSGAYYYGYGNYEPSSNGRAKAGRGKKEKVALEESEGL